MRGNSRKLSTSSDWDLDTALSEGVLESDLFGHEKGSFTGAYREKVGKFEYVTGGTIFLDEIGDLSPAIQAKLLHAVEDKEIQRIGGNRTIRIDTRVNRRVNLLLLPGSFASVDPFEGVIPWYSSC